MTEQTYFGNQFLIGISYPGGAFVVATFHCMVMALDYAGNAQAKSDDEWKRDGESNPNVFTIIDDTEKEEQ